MNLYTGDLHFGHQNVIHFDNRPFADIDEMDRTLISLWNSRVRPDDHVYIVGDFAWRNQNPEEWYLSQLKGHKHLLIGNHDDRLLNNPSALSYFESVDKIAYLTDKGNHICLCHFPLAEWSGYFKGHYHIYGHIHNQTGETWQFMKTRERALNAGCMINNYMPVTFRELVENNRIFREQADAPSPEPDTSAP